MKLGRICLATLTVAFLASCLEQYDPRSHWSKLEEERKAAHATHPELTDKGELPKTTGGPAVKLSAVDRKYNTLCVSCHGSDGKADSPQAMAMNPRPRNFTDKKWQASVDDKHIKKVIMEGGAAVGLSATMVPWGAQLPGKLGDEMVKKVRSFR